jgi:hypothetical protein
MTLLDDVLRGVQVPQILHLPPGVVSLDAATEAIELAEAAGLVPDDAQRHMIQAALGERADGSWAAYEVCNVMARQNGKNDSIIVRQLAGLFLFDEPLQIHTAHEFPTANESFLRIAALIEGCDDLRRKVARVRYANGEQGIELLNGNRLKYRARTGGSGRGFAGVSTVYLDEALQLEAKHMGALTPAMATSAYKGLDPQIFYASSAGLSTSLVLWGLRKRALSGNGGRLAYIEHTAEAVHLDPDGRVISARPDPDDRRFWAIANPALGLRITEEFIEGQRASLSEAEFCREHLTVWDPMVGDNAEVVIPTAAWVALHDPTSTAASEQVIVGVSASEDRKWASIAVAAHRSDGLRHVEVVAHRPGVAWLAAELKAMHTLDPSLQIALMPSDPAGSVVVELEAFGVEVLKVGAQAFAGHCGSFFDAVMGQPATDGNPATPPSVRHREGPSDAPDVRASLIAAARRSIGTGWVWSCAADADISALRAVTLAHGLLPAAAPAAAPAFFVY